jgi:exopolyphosphatase
LGLSLVLGSPAASAPDVEVRHYDVQVQSLPNLSPNKDSSSNEISKFSEFLKQCKDVLQRWNEIREDHELILVLGNEAADLDSIVCSLVLAYFLQDSKSSGNRKLYVPVINIPKNDLELRKDASFLLEFTGVSGNELVFIDEVNLDQFISDSLSLTDFHVILVDHNHLAESQSVLAPHVIGIFDHHLDEGDFDFRSLEYYQIKAVGSCASLIALLMKNDQKHSLMNRNIATLMMGVILLDTVNFNPVERKTTEADLFAYLWLYYFNPVSHDGLFRLLNDLRSNTEGLSTFQLFRKDLKFNTVSGTRYAISAVSGLALQDWLSEDFQLFTKMNRFAKQINVSMFCILTKGIGKSDSQPLIIKDLTCLGSNTELLKTVSESLSVSGFVEDHWKMNDLQENSPNFFVRLNDSSSRKRLNPLILDAIKQSYAKSDR